MKIFKIVLAGLGIILVIIQFFQPEKNQSGDNTYGISTQYDMPEDIKLTFKEACNDCHSNTTRYPWYANVQPVGWWLNDHVQHGKGHLNLSEFTQLPIARQLHGFEEIKEVIEENSMPLPSYTQFGLHAEANLSEDQKVAIIDWAEVQMEKIRSQYPPDSLVMKRRRH